MSKEILPPVAPRPGSALYYAALYTDEQTRDRYLYTTNLNAILCNSLIDVQDPDVAQQKIHWWHEELDRLDTNSATHPSLIACQSFHDKASLKKHCMAILSAAANERMSPPTSRADLKALLSSDYEARGILMLNSLKVRSPAAHKIMLEMVPVIAHAFSHSERLRQQRRLLHRGIPVFSDECYEDFDLSPSALTEHMAAENPHNEKINQFMAHRVDLAAAAWAEVEAVLTIDVVKKELEILPLLILTRLRQQQVLLWQKQRLDLLREYSTPTPLRKFWLTWRLMRKTK